MTQPDPIVLPCGCRFDPDVIDGVNTLILTACARGLDCPYARYAVDESRRQQKPTTIIGGPDGV